MSTLDFSVLSNASPNSAEFKSALSRISQETSRRMKSSPSVDSLGFFSGALKAIASLRGVSHLEQRMLTLSDCAAFFYLNRRLPEALAASELMTSLAKKLGDNEWLRRSHHYFGTSLAESGRIADAVIAHSVALEHARLLDEQREAKSLINMGCAYNFGALYSEALPCFESAVAKTARTQNSDYWAALSNLAETHYFLSDFERAYEFITQAVNGEPQKPDALEASGLAIRQFIAFKISIERGDLQLAEQHLERCTRYANKSGVKRSLFAAEIGNALLKTYKGDLEGGLEILTDSLRHGQNTSPYYEETLAALVRAYERAGEFELALEHMELRIRYLSKLRREAFGAPDLDVSKSTTGLLHLQLAQSELRTKVAERSALRAHVEMLERLAVTADLKEEASGEHGYRVGRLSALMAEALGWSREQCRAIDLAARLHDIGKIAMPDRILLTSEQLKEAERQIMSTHTLVGAELLAKSNVPQLQMAEEIAKFHHEWWNGEGYPTRRRERRIPQHARIVAIADVFDALTHGRPFAAPWSMDDAIAEIAKRRGTQFDPELVDVFMQLIAKLRAKHADLDAYLGKAGRNSPFLQAREKIRRMLAEPSSPAAASARDARETVH